MKCPTCTSDALTAQVTLVLDVPLAKRRGTIQTKGVVVTQDQIKAAWDRQPLEHRGPVLCGVCGERLEYTRSKGLQKLVTPALEY